MLKINPQYLPALGVALAAAVGAVVAVAVSLANAAQPATYSPTTLAIQDRTFVDAARSNRKIPMLLWHGVAEAPATGLVGDNPVFAGLPVQKGVEVVPTASPRPLVLLSHGSGGNLLNQGWLAADLVARGYLVASLSHPGSTTGDSSPRTTLPVWERARDVSAALDRLLADPVLGPMIDRQHIAAIGHSLGGYTVLALAGARLDADRHAALCQRVPTQGDCAFFRAGGVSFAQADAALVNGSHRDPRISAVVAMSPAFAQAFQPDSLEAIRVPTLVVGLTGDELLPHASNAVPLAAAIPGARLLEQKGGHFSVLPRCKPGAKALLADEPDPSDRLICDDAGADRAAAHDAVRQAIEGFLGQAGFS